MDRRVKRTKAAVFNAVLDLLVEKDTEKITVLELCKRADINKSTFYLHYRSMEDCLQSCFDIIMNGIVEFSKNFNYEEMQKAPEENIQCLLNEVEKKKDYLYKFRSSAICGSSIKVLKEKLVKSISEHNGFTVENNYREICSIAFVVAGSIDCIMQMLPVFDKKSIAIVMRDMIKRN